MKYEPPNFQDMYNEEHKKVADLTWQVGAMREDLRDKFAMAALTGILANEGQANKNAENRLDIIQIDAECAYLYASAMLEARKEKP